MLPARAPLPEQVADQLIEMIVTEKLPPGTVLPPEAVIAAQFGVSRPVFREAVHMLQAKGLIRVRQGSGTYVNAVAEWRIGDVLTWAIRSRQTDLQDWMEVRLILEVEAARLAALRATASDQSALLQPLHDMEENGGTIANQFNTANIALHLAIAAATHNRPLLIIIQSILAPLQGRMGRSLELPGTAHWVNQDHREICEAILQTDGDAAAAAMARHLQQTMRRVREGGYDGTVSANDGNPGSDADNDHE